MSLPLVRPPALRPGDVIGVFTPSSPAHVWFREKYLHGVAQLRALGFGVRQGALTAAATHQGYRSGSPRARADEVMELVLDPGVHGLMATIGGLNSASLLPYLDFGAIRAHPKVICGYSDVTSLHLGILARAGLSTFYGPAVVPSFGEWPGVLPETADSFLDAVRRHRAGPRALSPPPRWSGHFRDARTDAWKAEPRRWEPNPGWRTLVPGRAAAPLVIANLDTLTRLAGTPYLPPLEGTLLLLEEMDAPLAREEANLRHLQLMGVFTGLAGLVMGKPERYDALAAPFGYDELLMEILGAPGFPVVAGFDCGHTHPMLTLAQGTPVTLDARGGTDVSVVVNAPMVAPE